MNKQTLFEKEYDGESLYDLGRDVSEAIMTEYNEKVEGIPMDENGYQRGKFTVTLVWEDSDER